MVLWSDNMAASVGRPRPLRCSAIRVLSYAFRRLRGGILFRNCFVVGQRSRRRPSLRSSLQRTVVRRHLPFTGPWVGTGLRGDSSPPSDTTPAGRHLPAEFLSSVTTPAEMNWPAEFLDDLAGVCIIIIERNRLRANKMRKLSLLLAPARWYVFS